MPILGRTKCHGDPYLSVHIYNWHQRTDITIYEHRLVSGHHHILRNKYPPNFRRRIFPAIWEVVTRVRTSGTFNCELSLMCTLGAKGILPTPCTFQHSLMSPNAHDT